MDNVNWLSVQVAALSLMSADMRTVGVHVQFVGAASMRDNSKVRR